MTSTFFKPRAFLGLAFCLPFALHAQTSTPTPIPEEIKQTDRELLQKLETKEKEPATTAEASVSPSPSTATETKTEKPKAKASAETRTKKSSARQTATKTTPATRKRSEATSSPTPKPQTTLIRRLLPAVAEYRGAAPVEPRPEVGMSRRDMERLRDRVEDFVEEYFDTAERNDLARHLDMYAEKVSYFGDRAVSKARIAKSTSDYNARWPRRSYSLKDDPEVTMDGNKYVVQFPMAYRVHSGRDVAKGRMFYTMQLIDTDAGFKIVSVDERPMR